MPILDFVAFSGQRTHTVVSAGFTRAQLTDAFVETLLEGGWEIVSGPTVQSSGNGYFFKSQQVPWYNEDDPPDWYLGNRIVLQIDNSNGTDMIFRYGALYDESVEHMMSASQVHIIRMSSVSGFAEHILACPYQLVFWSERVDSFTNGERYAGCFVSALNLPKFVQQRYGIIHSILAYDGLRNNGATILGSASNNIYCIYRDKFGANSSKFQSNRVSFFVPMSGISFGTSSGRRVWSYPNDPDMSDNSGWAPFYAPARAIYSLPSTTTRTINGFLWDAVITTQSLQLNAEIDIGGFRWINFAGNHTYSSATDRGPQLHFRIS